MPGTSSTRRSPTRRSSAGSSTTTACSCAGWRRPTVLRARRGARRAAAASRAATATATASACAALFAHIGGDIGDSAQLARRLVAACSRAEDRALRRRGRARRDGHAMRSAAQRALDRRRGRASGRPTAMPTQHQLQAAGRVFPRARESGALAYDTHGRRPAPTATAPRSRGWYLQGVYQFMPRWRVGPALRPARLRHAGDRPRRTTARWRRPTSRCCAGATRRAARVMLDWSPDRVQPPAPAARARQVARRRDRQPGLPPIHHEPGRARRAQLLGERHENLIARCLAAAARAWRPCPRTPRSTCSPASPNGARWRSELGGDKVERLRRDHRRCRTRTSIEARPSLIARTRSADLLVCTGVELEIGWLPVLLAAVGQREDRARRSRATSRPADFVRRSRCRRGSIAPRATSTPAGNPHIQLDPRNIAHGGRRRWRSAWRRSMPANAALYRAARRRLSGALERGDAQLGTGRPRRCAACRVVVAAQELDLPLSNWLGHARGRRRSSPSPASSRAAAHLSRCSAQLKTQPAKMVVRAAYEDGRAPPSGWPSAPASRPSCCPSPSAATTRRRDLFGLFDDTVARLLQGVAK